MGTLTAGQPRLPQYCEHKLPTSCRLTSIPECCACADERAHAAAYSTYIDGVGFVARGNRWQRYCWFCKEFWETRVRVSGLSPGQTRIPERPDQREFLEKWYEFHQGYRTVMREDGSEERVSVLGEDFRDVSPGYLPRTLEELRAGRDRVEDARIERPVIQQSEHEEEDGPTLEDTLDQMLLAASNEEEPQPQPPPRSSDLDLVGSRGNIHAQAMAPAASRNREYQTRRVAALRRELHRMRNGIERVISGLRDLGENVPDHAETTGRLTELGDTIDAITDNPSQDSAQRALSNVNRLANDAQASHTDRAMARSQVRVDEARNQHDEARRMRDQAATDLDHAETEFRTTQRHWEQLQREQRTTENYLRLFGTREEMIEQGEDYESPIGGMFTRAYDRFRAAEEVRREERTLRQVLQDEERSGGEAHQRRLSELEGMNRDVWGVPLQRSHDVPHSQPEQLPRAAEGLPGERLLEDEAALEEYYAMHRRQDWTQHASRGETEGGQEEENFPRNMLAALMAARNGDTSQQGLAPDITLEDWKTLDAVDVANHIEQHGLPEDMTLHLSPATADALVRRVQMGHMSLEDRETLEAMLSSTHALFSFGLPTQWLNRRRDYLQAGGEGIFVNQHPQINDSTPESLLAYARQVDHCLGIEVMAQAFQLSAGLRARAPDLNPTEQMDLLQRLQEGRRSEADRDLLRAKFVEQHEIFEQGQRIFHETITGESSAALEARHRVEQTLRQLAHRGDHSRQELDASRRATQAFAVAAGRTAMQTGPQALLERMADRDDQTRAAYARLQENGFAPPPGESRTRRGIRAQAFSPMALSSPSSASDDERDEGMGLDAADSGRPEPKSNEEMLVQMDCKICFTQTAEIACLPCGHLVMCQWCSEQHSPSLQHDKTRPRRAAACPVCRKGMRQKIRVFRA